MEHLLLTLKFNFYRERTKETMLSQFEKYGYTEWSRMPGSLYLYPITTQFRILVDIKLACCGKSFCFQ